MIEQKEKLLKIFESYSQLIGLDVAIGASDFGVMEEDVINEFNLAKEK